MPKEMPKTVNRFCNLFWANFPGHYIIKFLFHRKTLFVSIIVEHECDIKQQLRRQYSQKTIDSHKDLWKLVQKCCREVKISMLEPEE